MTWKRLTIAAIALLLVQAGAEAQVNTTRFGFGTGLVLNPSNDDIADDEVGMEFRGRISRALNDDVSLAGGVGLYAFAFNGTDDADYVLHPQASIIVTLNGQKRFPYVMFGVGGLFPTDSDMESKLNVHFGYGWAWPLTSVSVFAELNPSIAFDDNSSDFVVPLRLGLIF